MILGMIVLFSAFMMFTVLTLLVVEKTRDIGVLESMGATPEGIARIYLFIGLTLCLAGTALGTAYGVGFAASVNTIQRWVKLLVGLEVFSQRVYYLERIPGRFDAGDLAWIIVPTVVETKPTKTAKSVATNPVLRLANLAHSYSLLG